ncbi:MAG: GTP-binding protein [Candidatus Lokiarchaeota archaeon]|nr:GTP-binding protein [Candidatus Lokiarchaeota archaeon]
MVKGTIPVHLLTGFFGSGKTTLINHVLASIEKGKHVAVMVNDFGDVNVDSEVIGHGHAGLPEVHSVAGGSIFCSCRHWEFITGLHALAAYKPDFIIVEASGMADPTPIKTDIKIASTLDKEHEYVHASTACLVDAALFKQQLDVFPVVRRQVKHATTIVVNKVDLLAEPVEPKKATIRTAIRRINKHASIEFTIDSIVPVAMFLAAGTPGDDEARPDRSLNEPGNQPGTAVLVASHPLDRAILREYYESVKDKILRFKGFCQLDDGWYHVNAVADQLRFSPTRAPREKTEILCIFLPASDAKKAELQDSWRQVAG